MNDLFVEDQALQREAAQSALDELFHASRTYKASKKYLDLMHFIRRFRKYSPFNCLLLHTQRPEVSYVATATQWKRDFRRYVKDGARPMVILAPMSPVLFVFDATDTDGAQLPDGLIDPYATTGNLPASIWDRAVWNLFRDRIKLVERPMERKQAGGISVATNNETVSRDGQQLPARYLMEVNSVLAVGGKYATLAHELGHLYAGHLGTPNERWWPNRKGVAHQEREFEAESICYLVCERAGIENPSDAYLSNYLREHEEVPDISLDRVLRAVQLIEEMGRSKLKPRERAA